MEDASHFSDLTAKSTTLSGTTEELFRMWLQTALSMEPNHRLHAQAKRFFGSLQTTSITTPTGETLQTRAVNPLPKLLQQLGPALEGTSLPARAAALDCIAGAVEGSTSLPEGLLELLAKFLMAHVGPLEAESVDDDWDEEVRDQAVQCATVWMRKSKDVARKLSWAQEVVLRRSTVPEEEGIEKYYATPTAGLSALPRARRSLCFRLLRVTIDSLQGASFQDVDTKPFCLFCIDVLHGESDPRCLLQLLQMLCALQTNIPRVPARQVFDAVAPYYPIQFTPPPNDVHGITKEGLQMALLAVLSDESLVSESLELFLETVVPDDTPVVKEQVGSLLDIATVVEEHTHKVQDVQWQSIAKALPKVHADFSQQALKTKGSEQHYFKKAAADCRSVAARIAAAAETHSGWRIVVEQVLQRLDFSQSLRLSIAYTACLAASGGPKTLQRSLQVGMNTIFEAKDKASAAYGLGALFSSARVAMKKCKGVKIHPHPLEEYSGKSLDWLIEQTNEQCEVDVRIAAIRAVESVLTIAPAQQFEPDQLLRINDLLQLLIDTVPVDDEDSRSFVQNCATTLGYLLGDALNDETTTSQDANVLHGHARLKLTKESLSSLVEVAISTGPRPVFKALSLATTSSLCSADRIVGMLLESMKQSIESGATVRCENSARCLANLFRTEGSYASQAFQSSSKLSLEVISALLGIQASSLDEDLSLQMAKDLHTAYYNVVLPQHAHAVVSLLLASLETKNISQTTSVQLSYLSALLQQEKIVIDRQSQKKLEKQVGHLTSIAFSSVNSSHAQSNAAQCLVAIISKCIPKGGECPVRPLLVDKIMPKVRSSLHDMQVRNERKRNDAIAVFTDSVSLMGVLTSAAAQKGGLSAKTADEVICMFVDLACRRFASDTFAGEGNELSIRSNERKDFVAHEISKAVGAIISSESCSRIWKQRVGHMVCTRLERNVDDASSVSPACLQVVGYVVCCGTVKSLPSTSLPLLVNIVLRSLSPTSPILTSAYGAIILKLMLCSALKILSVVPEALKDDTYSLITASLRSYAAADKFPSGDALACKLLAIQLLQAVSNMEGAEKTLHRSREPVVSTLGAAMNHSSCVLRQAAVEARNSWYLAQ